MKMIVNVFFLFTQIGFVYAQVTWQNTYVGDTTNYGRYIHLTSDGGYIIGGESYSFGEGKGDIMIMKLDAYGTVDWVKSYGGTKFDMITSLQETGSSGYILSGITNSFGAGAYILKVNYQGNLEWTKVISGSFSSGATGIVESGNSGYMLCSNIDNDVCLISLDINGTTLWTKKYGGTELDIANSFLKSSDGNYVFCGHSSSFSSTSEIYVVKADSSGNILWENTYSAGNNVGTCISETIDGGFVIGGYSTGFGQSGIVLRISENGNLLWSKNISKSGNEFVRSVYEADNNNILVVTTSHFSSYELEGSYIINLDSTGNVQWIKMYQEDLTIYINHVSQSNDGGIMLAGNRIMNDTLTDIFIAKLDSSGSSCIDSISTLSISDYIITTNTSTTSVNSVTLSDSTGGIEGTGALNVNKLCGITSLQEKGINNSELTVYPNPFTISTTIQYTLAQFSNNVFLYLYGITGKEIYYSRMTSQNGKIELNSSQLTPGTYFVKLVVDEEVARTEKFVIVK
ncbi:T9SS type A sorting domain-containing protein [Candidatus Amoebophilus asiaticus]|nr:T9SS type A sorting domain-containing protein [Candidatus Amoebophilus asiaticus]